MSADAHDDDTEVIALRHGHPSDLVAVPPGPLRLSWSARSSDATAGQEAYQLRWRGAAGDWADGEEVASGDSLDVSAPGGPLAPRERREFAVRLRTSAGWTGWSPALPVEGALSSSEVEAEMVDIPSTIAGPVPIVRREFDLPAAPARARLTVTALGAFEVRVNGAPVDHGVLGPGWTSYRGRVLTETLDVTSLLRPGTNAVAIRFADAWYRGRMGFSGRTAIYGHRIGALAQLEWTDADGGTGHVVTDGSWRGGFGELRSASIYDGSEVDLGLSVGDPSVAGFDDGEWESATAVPFDRAVLEPRGSSPVRIVDRRDMTVERRDGGARLDSGQNLAGWVALRVRGRAGTRVTVRHAEVLEPDGALHLTALRSAKATDVYTLADDGETLLEPPFTFHGFRYADVETDAEVLGATAVAVSSALHPRSTFTSSHEGLNRFHENVRWSQLGNFVSLPTDCPQRDERLGWTGDAQAFAPTAATLFDVRAFLGSWLRDLELDQTDEGGVASVVPNIIGADELRMGEVIVDSMGRAGWADAATIVPLALHESYGDRAVLAAQLDSMRRWVEHLRRRAGSDVLLPHEPFQYGDWLDPDAPGDRPWEAKADADLVANAFYARSARLLAEAERIVGDPACAEEYDRLADTVAEATWSRWEREVRTTQTGAALALEFGLAPDDERAGLAEGLAQDVRRAEGRIETGFLGTPLILFALSNAGHLGEAYLMLLRREAPSWLYQVDRGATTVWERWDAILPDGSIHGGAMDAGHPDGDSSGMISFNHYAYGAMIDWVYRTLAGLAPDPRDPGYRTIRVAPRPVEGIDHAVATVETSWGEARVAWRVGTGGDLELDVAVPFGCRALLDLPVDDGSSVSVDGSPASAEGRLGHGSHRVTVTRPRVVAVAR